MLTERDLFTKIPLMMTGRGKATAVRAIVLGAIAVVALLAAGCGGGDDAPTKAEFKKQAIVICGKKFGRISPGIQRYARENAGPETKAWKEGLTKQAILPPLQTETEEFEDLTPPKGDEEQVEAIIKAFKGVLKEGEEEPLVILKGAGGPALVKVNRLFAAYGIPQCEQS